jgi:hypothetical protein
MRTLHFIITLAVAVALQNVLGQGTVFTDNRLPASSVELKPHDAPATVTPWQLPKPGDPLYDAAKEADIKSNPKSHWVHAFERGVFIGYKTLTADAPPQRSAKEMNDTFTPNAKLPADAVQLSDAAQPDKSDYFPTRPKTRPPNVPLDCIAVRVFHRGQVIGWTFMPKRSVALLHQPK